MKHVAASTAARLYFSFADGCFNVWSPLSPICPCAIQLTSGERPVYDSTFSSSLSSRSARKTQVRSRKKTSERKKTRLAAGEKTPCSGKKLFLQRGKMPAKNAASQREKFKAAEKTPCSSTKAPLQQKKCILEAAGKNRPRREKTRPRQEKNRPRQEKNQQQRKSSFATQKVAATEKIHFRNGKKQQPSGLASQTWPCHILGSHKGWFLRNRCLPHVDVLKVGFFHSSSCHACLGQASVSLGAPRMPTNLLHHGSQNRIQKTSRKTWRPERDLDCTRNTVGRREKKHVLTLTLMLVRRKSACKTSPGSSKILRWLTPLLGPNLDPKTGPKQRPKRRNENVIQFWTPFWGPYLDPKMGSAIGEFRCCPHMLCKQICDPAA